MNSSVLSDGNRKRMNNSLLDFNTKVSQIWTLTELLCQKQLKNRKMEEKPIMKI